MEISCVACYVTKYHSLPTFSILIGIFKVKRSEVISPSHLNAFSIINKALGGSQPAIFCIVNYFDCLHHASIFML